MDNENNFGIKEPEKNDEPWTDIPREDTAAAAPNEADLTSESGSDTPSAHTADQAPEYTHPHPPQEPYVPPSSPQYGSYQNTDGPSLNNTVNYQQSEPNSMSTASLVMGIISLVLCCCFYVSIPLGALGILFAILSKGKDQTMSGRSKTGLGLSIAGLVLTILLTIGMLVANLTYMGSEGFSRQMKEYMEYYNRGYYDGEEDIDDLLDRYLNDNGYDSRPKNSYHFENDL
ncbi:MAG: DUF4190 domain-containing protein [Lachnospiraceae bacterium]|jgi:hypothetical protein|nr:DUF4190 domain-containing protein [Lachnospiraceae bacterium]